MPRWPKRTIVERFLEKVDPVNDGCWIWCAGGTRDGYGTLRIGPASKGKIFAHVLSYQIFVGPVPETYDVDHLCRVKSCVNPWHLEPVTRQENLRRGIQAQLRKTHCPKGHPYDGANTRRYRFPDGHPARFCRQCERERDRRREVTV